MTTQRTEFDATIQATADGQFLVEIPPQVAAREQLAAGESIQVAVSTSDQQPARTSMASDDGRPVRKGEFLDVETTELGDEGDGIAFIDGFAVIVEGAGIGEQLTVEVIDVQESFAVAKARAE